MKSFDFSYFRVAFSSDTAILSVIFESNYPDSLEVYLSPAFQSIWSPVTATQVSYTVRRF
jgi:hypothetical protein